MGVRDILSGQIRRVKMESKNIYQRINAVMKEEIYIKKGSAGQGTGVLHDELLAVLTPFLVREGIVVEVHKDGESRSRQNQKGNYIYECDFNVFYVNIDNPEDKVCVLIESHAMDSGDKAPGKAITYAAKTAHLKTFCIETGVNDESRAEAADTDTITQEQANILFNLLCTPEGQYTDKGLRFCKAYKFNNLLDIKSKKFEEILKAAQK